MIRKQIAEDVTDIHQRKRAPYNATGNGVTNDYPFIIAALTDAAAAGRTVYF
jgi:hypothetical protein